MWFFKPKGSPLEIKESSEEKTNEESLSSPTKEPIVSETKVEASKAAKGSVWSIWGAKKENVKVEENSNVVNVKDQDPANRSWEEWWTKTKIRKSQCDEENKVIVEKKSNDDIIVVTSRKRTWQEWWKSDNETAKKILETLKPTLQLDEEFNNKNLITVCKPLCDTKYDIARLAKIPEDKETNLTGGIRLGFCYMEQITDLKVLFFLNEKPNQNSQSVEIVPKVKLIIDHPTMKEPKVVQILDEGDNRINIPGVCLYIIEKVGVSGLISYHLRKVTKPTQMLSVIIPLGKCDEGQESQYYQLELGICFKAIVKSFEYYVDSPFPLANIYFRV